MVFRPSFLRTPVRSKYKEPLVTEVVPMPSIEDGEVNNKVYYQKVPLSQVCKKVIKPELYTLENLLKSGTPIEDIDTSSMFNVSSHEMEQRYSPEINKAFEKLQSIVESDNKK